MRCLFLKSVDTFDIKKDATTIYSLFIIDNVADYKKAKNLLHERQSNIYKSPCAANCLNLILKNY